MELSKCTVLFIYSSKILQQSCIYVQKYIICAVKALKENDRKTGKKNKKGEKKYKKEEEEKDKKKERSNQQQKKYIIVILLDICAHEFLN